MMAAALPLRPVMVFVHDEETPMIAAFRQNSALRLRAGYEAEIVFPSIPGRVFAGEVRQVLPAIGEAQATTSGTLIGTEAFRSFGHAIQEYLWSVNVSRINDFGMQWLFVRTR